MYTVIETPIFLRQAAKIWSEEEHEAFVNHIAVNPMAGSVIPGFAPLRKVRFSASGKGTRGGARVIYLNRLKNSEVVLLAVYVKSEAAQLSQAFLQLLKKEMSDEPS